MDVDIVLETVNMEDRERSLGFKPQREVPYNALLPYSDALDKESNGQLADIKANLARTIQLRDVKIGGSHWTGQLSKYIRLFGLKFTKEDHLMFITLLMEMLKIPDLDYSLIQKFAQLLISLLKKRELIARNELIIEWRPLHKLLYDAAYSPYEHLGLVLLPANITQVLKNLIRVCRVYFSAESTQEMLNEWRPLLCPFDVKMSEGLSFLELFLPTLMYPEEYDKGFRLWFDELIGIWDACEINPSWEGNLVSLFSRLAADCKGYVDWQPYMSKIFTRILRSMNLPVGTGNLRITQNHNSYEPIPTAVWLANMLGGNSSTQQHLNKLFSALESFYHPSNYGRWNTKLLKLLRKLPFHIVKRVHKERYLHTWEPSVPETVRLTDADITQFVNSLTDIASLAMFNKVGSNDSSATLQSLAMLRPEIVIPPLLEKTYPALETLTEPHRLIACLQCTVAVSRCMLSSPKWYPEGRTHVIPLMNLCLPGIDPNDVRKSLITFQLLSTLASLVPIVDCSEASRHRTDLTEDEVDLCSATAQFEDVVVQFFDRVFALIENSVHQHTRGSDTATVDRLNPEEAMLEVCLLSTANSIMQQCSLPIYKRALKRLQKFASESIFEIKVAGRFTSDLVRAATKVHPEIALKIFLPGVCRIISHRATTEDLSKEEHIDNEFLWNLKLLSELVRCDGRALVLYSSDIIAVVKATIHLTCKEAQELSCTLLRHMLRALTLVYVLEYRSTTLNWDSPLSEYLPIREWGKCGDLHDLQVEWHCPTVEEKEFARQLLIEFLVPEFKHIDQHITGSVVLSRDELLQSLNIIYHCMIGAGNLLPAWTADIVPLVESCVDLKRYSHVASNDSQGLTIDGRNVRLVVIDCIRPLLDHMLSSSEDDTKSLIAIVRIINSVMYFHGIIKEEFDSRWKSRHIVKQFMEHKLLGKKQHIRALLIDRTQLQHELRGINQAAKYFTTVHKQLFTDLLRLSVSRYMEVRKSAQASLAHGFHVFAYSYRCVLDDVIKILQQDTNVAENHQFKGALYIVLGESKRSLVTKRNWDVLTRLWPALVQAQLHCEKPSVLRLFDDVIDKLHSDIETTELTLVVHEGAINAAGQVWRTASAPAPSLPSSNSDEMSAALIQESNRNSSNLQGYQQLVEILVNLAETGNLQWKFHQVSLEMLLLLIRYDVRLPACAVRLFVNNMTNEAINVRKICTAAVSAILKQQKRQHQRVEIDPYTLAKVPRPSDPNDIRPGDRPDNRWMQYVKELVPESLVDWSQFVFIEKTHWGFYTWPLHMWKYAATEHQPTLSRTLNQLSDEEKPVYEQFTNSEFVETLIKFLTLEENKGKDRFHAKFFILFKGLFRNFDETVLNVLKSHVERLVADTSHDTHETSHRCAAEIISGLIRGSKHWNYSRLQAMWAWLIPVIRTALVNFTVESLADWGTCFATASENRDPYKLSPVLELLISNPLSGDGGSFGDSGRLYLLQGILAQQEWRIAELLRRLYTYLLPHLRHPYKNIRDRIGSTLVNLFLYDVKLPRGAATLSPTRAAFIDVILPQLDQLRILVLNDAARPADTNGAGAGSSLRDNEPAVSSLRDSSEAARGTEVDHSNDMEVDENGCENGSNEDKERKSLINLCKTVLKWLQGTCSRTFQCLTADTLRLLPLLCLLETESKDPELRRESLVTLGYMGQSLLSVDAIPAFIAIANEISQMSSWHARCAILSYLQLTVFCNLFVLQSPDVINNIRQLVLRLLCDEQLEVRELAGVTLSGFLQCGFLTLDKQTIKHFETLSVTRIKKRSTMEVVNGDVLIRRHAGVIGLCACVLAFPYQVPDFIPQVLMHLSSHVNDPQPIQGTVKKALGTFKRTHLDSWHDHKQKFTDDQLVVLTELLVSPNYYA